MKSFFTLFAFFSTSLLLAQFPNITWEYEIGAPAFGSAAAADIDDDVVIVEGPFDLEYDEKTDSVKITEADDFIKVDKEVDDEIEIHPAELP